MKSEPFEVAVELREGFTLAAYGVDARIIELPGHSRGSIGVVSDDGLIAGDALTNLFPPAGKAALWSDRAAMEASAAKAGALGELIVWFGHGGPARNKEW
jgi:glyoxylase-like metal-dependent hydrolase (beta-lactamase superfamily II)